jgi:exonuclease VII small subunit
MNETTLDMFEQKAYEEAMEAYQLCEEFAAHHELPVEYVWQEFVDPTVANLEAVIKALDFGPPKVV